MKQARKYAVICCCTIYLALFHRMITAQLNCNPITNEKLLARYSLS